MGGGQCAECQKKQVNGKALLTKLAISETGDTYEREADRIAEQVMRVPLQCSGHEGAELILACLYSDEYRGQVSVWRSASDRT
jgi:hypothetical protein